MECLGEEENAMPRPKPKYPIQLLENEEKELRQLVRSRKARRGKVMRARSVLDAHDHPEWRNLFPSLSCEMLPLRGLFALLRASAPVFSTTESAMSSIHVAQNE